MTARPAARAQLAGGTKARFSVVEHLRRRRSAVRHALWRGQSSRDASRSIEAASASSTCG